MHSDRQIRAGNHDRAALAFIAAFGGEINYGQVVSGSETVRIRNLIQHRSGKQPRPACEFDGRAVKTRVSAAFGCKGTFQGHAKIAGRIRDRPDPIRIRVRRNRDPCDVAVVRPRFQRGGPPLRQRKDGGAIHFDQGRQPVFAHCFRRDG